MTQNIQSLHDVITELDCIFNVLYENILYVFFIYIYIYKGKGKMFPLQARCGPEGG